MDTALSGIYSTETEVSLISSTGTDTVGYESSNVCLVRQGRYWIVPSGGPHTLVVEFQGRADQIGIVLTSPMGRPMIGDVTLSLVMDFGIANLPFGPYTLPKYVSEKFRDQRIILPPITSSVSGFNRATFTFASGSAVSRVAILNAQYATFTKDSLAGGAVFDKSWVSSSAEIVKNGSNLRGGTTLSPLFTSTPARYRTLSGGVLMEGMTPPGPPPETSYTLRKNGVNGELVVLMNAVDHAAGTVAQKKLMHKRSLLGRMTSQLVYQKQSMSTMYRHNLQFKELI